MNRPAWAPESRAAKFFLSYVAVSPISKFRLIPAASPRAIVPGRAERITSDALSAPIAFGASDMQQTALPRASTQAGASTGKRLLERCWRVIVAPDGHIATCGVYQHVNGDLQLRITYKPEQIVRVAVVQHLDEARSIAKQWLIAARQGGRFDFGT